MWRLCFATPEVWVRRNSLLQGVLYPQMMLISASGWPLAVVRRTEGQIRGDHSGELRPSMVRRNVSNFESASEMYSEPRR